MSTTKEEIALMNLKIENLEKKLEDMDDKLDKMNSSLLDPDKGFVARVNKNTEFRQEVQGLVGDIYAMKRWRESMTWAVRVLFVAVIGALAKLFLS